MVGGDLCVGVYMVFGIVLFGVFMLILFIVFRCKVCIFNVDEVFEEE